jgi:hypothetical protein
MIVDRALSLLSMLLLAALGRGRASSSGGRMSYAQIRDLAARTGFPDPDIAAAIAMAESHGDPSARNVHGPRPGELPECSIGLWQVNVLAHRQYDPVKLTDPSYNARAAYEISQRGTDWTPWSTYRHGDYRAYLPEGHP